MVFPGIDSIEEQLVFRSLGEPSFRQRIGCGFMHKSGVTGDEVNARFTTYALVYVIRGRGQYICEDGQKISLQPGSLFQRFPGVVHSTVLDPDSRWLECFLDVGEEIYRALVSLRVVLTGEPVFWIPPGGGVEEEFYRLMTSLNTAAERELPRCGMEILQYCSTLLERAREGDDPVWNRIERSCADFASLADRRPDLREYCRNRGWGYESFRKSFTRKMGVSPGQYIIQRRIDEACRLLRSGRLSVKETAEILGYRSPYEFSAQFRRVTGWSPGSYRRAGQPPEADRAAKS